MCPALVQSRLKHYRPIRTVVADDEPLARELMGNLVRRDPLLDLVATAGSGSEALAAVQEFKPQLLLLDIQMPSLDGISVAEQLAGRNVSPYIIFVTAHDSFALQAFEVGVRDYIVKPVSKRRFNAAIRRARDELDGLLATDPDEDQMTVRDGDALVNLLPADIVWVSAANQYVQIHTVDGNRYVVSQSLRQFSLGLPAQQFSRIHRSTLINRAHLTGILNRQGKYRAEMSDGSIHDIARNRKSLVPELLSRARENR